MIKFKSPQIGQTNLLLIGKLKNILIADVARYTNAINQILVCNADKTIRDEATQILLAA